MKKLKTILPKNSGRGALGHISVRHQGGRGKRFLRDIDFARDKRDIEARVETIEDDPNRNTKIARVVYKDGGKAYILSPQETKVGDIITSGRQAPVRSGNSLPLKNIPVGTFVHNIEIRPGKGGQVVRSGGLSAVVQSKEEDGILIRLPSGELKRFEPEAWATVGQLSARKQKRLGKAGKKRRMGIRPRVRGVAMSPRAHPHGGGEGRSGEGMPPKTPWGKPARGVKTRRKRKYSEKLIVEKRKRKR